MITQNNLVEGISAKKVGMQVIDYAVDEVYAYKTFISYKIGDDALLHLLWRYKGRMDIYTV